MDICTYHKFQAKPVHMAGRDKYIHKVIRDYKSITLINTVTRIRIQPIDQWSVHLSKKVYNFSSDVIIDKIQLM
jgi:hypothetical protein